jgi:hypothetical protein
VRHTGSLLRMSSSIPLQIAETIQTASIKRHPDVAHDLNPSTAASEKTPVTVSHHDSESNTSPDRFTYDEVDDIGEAEDEEDIPYDVIRPVQRRKSLPPLPDLRFEQSYLASIAGADTHWKVAYITIRDQVIKRDLTPFRLITDPLTCRSSSHSFRVRYGHWDCTDGDTGTAARSSTAAASEHGFDDGGGKQITGR